MKAAKQMARRREIEAAAYAELAERGYKATSMLAIARRAAASNETLYKWYGNKPALFASLVSGNAGPVSNLLADSPQADPLETIRTVGPRLLKLVTSERVVALNRAAAADVYETASLGQIIARSGRETVAPMIQLVFERARQQGLMRFDDTDDIAGVYINLLIGDLQIQRVIGARGPLKAADISARAQRAERLLFQLYGTARLRKRAGRAGSPD